MFFKLSIWCKEEGLTTRLTPLKNMCPLLLIPISLLSILFYYIQKLIINLSQFLWIPSKYLDFTFFVFFSMFLLFNHLTVKINSLNSTSEKKKTRVEHWNIKKELWRLNWDSCLIRFIFCTMLKSPGRRTDNLKKFNLKILLEIINYKKMI